VQALLDEGENLFYTYQYAAADDHFSQMIASDPDNVDALLWRARERLHVGSDDNVLADVTHAMELDPDNVDALLIFADWAAAHDDYLTAMAYLQMALALEPDNADVYNGFGGFYSNLDQYEEAVTYYTKALELDPNRPLIYNNRGAAFSWLRQDDLALANYARALELDPNHGVAMVNRAILELRHGDVEASLQDIEAAEQLRPRDPRVYELIGYFYARKYGDYEAAAEAYTTSIELAPQINPPYGARCNVYGNLGRFEEAMADCQYLIEHMTNDIHVYDHLGHLYLQMGDWQGGYDTFDKIIQLGGYPHAYWHRGYSSYRLGNYAEALDDINLALSMVDYSGYHYDRGLVYFRTGRVEEGFDELSTTFRISSIYLDSLTLDFPYRTSPESDIMNYLGWGKYYEALGKSGQARENYEAFLEAYGTNDDLYEAVEARIQVLQ
jgi:tetratricopeptide (TPR) repeat protein